MSVGTVLLIPNAAQDEALAASAAATPVPVDVSAPDLLGITGWRHVVFCAGH